MIAVVVVAFVVVVVVVVISIVGNVLINFCINESTSLHRRWIKAAPVLAHFLSSGR